MDGQSQLSSWIGRIAINQCYIAVRKDRRNLKTGPVHMLQFQLGEDEDGFIAEAGWMAVVDSDLAAVASRLDLKKILDEMKPLQRQLMSLVAVEGLEVKEAAKMLGLSPTAAKAKIWNAKRRSREQHLRHRQSGRTTPVPISVG